MEKSVASQVVDAILELERHMTVWTLCRTKPTIRNVEIFVNISQT